jgi:hypothetical protein
MIKIEAAARLLADRDRFGELELEKQHSNPDEDKLKSANEMIDKIREQIKEKGFQLREKEGPAKETLQGVILGLKKRANQLWHGVNPDAEPIYKIGAAKIESALNEVQKESMGVPKGARIVEGIAQWKRAAGSKGYELKSVGPGSRIFFAYDKAGKTKGKFLARYSAGYIL